MLALSRRDFLAANLATVAATLPAPGRAQETDPATWT
jgi:hypothetical protein